MHEPGMPADGCERANSEEDATSLCHGAREYLFDMLAQLAILAKKCGEDSVAVSLAMAVLEGTRAGPGGKLQ